MDGVSTLHMSPSLCRRCCSSAAKTHPTSLVSQALLFPADSGFRSCVRHECLKQQHRSSVSASPLLHVIRALSVLHESSSGVSATEGEEPIVVSGAGELLRKARFCYLLSLLLLATLPGSACLVIVLSRSLVLGPPIDKDSAKP